MSVDADLHIHTTASDGLLRPAEIVRLAESRKLSAIAVTDHDTVAGISEALEAAEHRQVQVIPGIELSSEYEDKEIHILGYFVDHKNNSLASLLEKLHHSRFGRTEKMVAKLCDLGFTISLEEVMCQAKDAAPGRPHVARVLVNKGFVSSVAEAFNTLLGYKMPGYVERYKLTPKEAILAIKHAGGIASWAHPGLSGNDDLLGLFVSFGLKGLEAYHPDHNLDQIKHYKQLAKEFGLFISGGSDFHGKEPGHSRDLAHCGISEIELHLIRNMWKNPLA